MTYGEALRGLGYSEWSHPRTGETRIYINNLAELYGIEAHYYNTGNVSSATVNGEHISNGRATHILSDLSMAKMWFEPATKHLQSTGLAEYRPQIEAELDRRVAEYKASHA